MPKNDEYVVDVYSEQQQSPAQLERSRKVLKKLNKEQNTAILKASMLGGAVAALSAGVVHEFQKMEQATKRFVNNFTLAPVLEGLQEYEAQMTSVRTMATNSAQWYTTEDGDETANAIKHVTDALYELNDYADNTVYKFSDMTYAAKRFVVAGLTNEDAANMTKGLGYLTAYLGGGAEEYSSAVYNYAQAMSNGKMMLRNFNPLAVQGLTGMSMQKLFIYTAKAMGKDAPEWEELAQLYDAEGNLRTDIEDLETFQYTLADDWLTSDVMLQALGKVMGQGKKLTREYLEELGYAGESVDFILKMAAEADSAANQVKTFNDLISVMQESVGTGWAKAFEKLFGDYTKATALWSGLRDQITGDQGDLTKLMDYIVSEFEAVGAGGSYEKMQKILNNIWKTIKNIIVSVAHLFGVVDLEEGALSGKINNLLDILVKITDLLSSGTLSKATTPLGQIVNFVAMLLGHLKNITTIVSGAAFQILTTIFAEIAKFFGIIKDPLDRILTKVETFLRTLSDSGLFERIGNFIAASLDVLVSLFGDVQNPVENLFDAFVQFFKLEGLKPVIDVVQGFFRSFIGMFGEEVEIKDFAKFAGKLVIGLAALVAVFWLISRIGKSFNGVENNFWTIISTTLAVVLGLKILNTLSIEDTMGVVARIAMLAVPIIVLMAVLKAIARLANNAGKLAIAMVVILAAIFGLIYGVSLIAQGTDQDRLNDTLNAIASIIKAISSLITALAVLGVVFAALAYVMSAGSIWRNKRKIAEANKKDLFDLNLNLGIDSASMMAIGIAAIVAAIALVIKNINNLSSLSWGDVGKLAAIVAIILGIVGLFVFLISKLAKSKQSSMGWTKMGGLSKTSSGSNIAGLILSLSVFMLALSGAISIISGIAKNLDAEGEMGRFAAIIGLMAALIAVIAGALALMSITKAKPSKIAAIGFSLIAFSLCILVLAGIAKLLESVDQTALYSMLTLLAIFGVVGAILAIASAFSEPKKLLAIAAVLVVLALAIAAISQIGNMISDDGLERLKSALIMLGIVFAVIVVVAAVASIWKALEAALLIVAAVLFAISLSLVTTALAAWLFVDAIDKLISMFIKFADVGVDKLTSGVNNVIYAITLLVSKAVVPLSLLGYALGQALFTGLVGFLTALDENIAEIAGTITDILVEILREVDSRAYELAELGTSIGVKIGNGIAVGLLLGMIPFLVQSNDKVVPESAKKSNVETKNAAAAGVTEAYQVAARANQPVVSGSAATSGYQGAEKSANRTSTGDALAKLGLAGDDLAGTLASLLGDSMKESLAGMGIYMDGTQVGEIVDKNTGNLITETSR